MPAVPPRAQLWPLSFAAWIKIGVCYQQASRELALGLRPLELSVAQFDALANLYGAADTISQQQLAERLLVTKGNVTGLIDRLVERGWVKRKSDPEDGRAYRLRLTRTGKQRVLRGLEVQKTLVNRMMAPLSAREQETLRQLLTRVARDIHAVKT